MVIPEKFQENALQSPNKFTDCRNLHNSRQSLFAIWLLWNESQWTWRNINHCICVSPVNLILGKSKVYTLNRHQVRNSLFENSRPETYSANGITRSHSYLDLVYQKTECVVQVRTVLKHWDLNSQKPHQFLLSQSHLHLSLNYWIPHTYKKYKSTMIFTYPASVLIILLHLWH